MLFFVLATVLCITVHGFIRDPTKVCLPDVIQFTNYIEQYGISLTVAYDFPHKVSANRLSLDDRQVFNMTDLTTSIVNDTDGSCVKHGPEDIVAGDNLQCLPANAVLLTTSPTHLGLHPGGLHIEVWEWTLPNSHTARAVITKGDQYVPVLMHITSKDSTWIEVFYNIRTSINDPDMFDIPPVCPPFTPAG